MLKKCESKQASGAERDAADRLAKLRDSMQERSMSSSRQHRDPVRIPGADESSAPRAWRQELMDAMKEKAPERFRAAPEPCPPAMVLKPGEHALGISE